MKPLYGFGLSQEDERTEAAALGLPGGHVLSVGSGGDMALSLLALGAETVVAVDIDPHQVHLAELKRAAVLCLEREEAVGFLGFLPATHEERAAWLDRLSLQLPAPSGAFWREHRAVAVRGAIRDGRYERYVALLRKLVAPFAARSFRSLVACRTLEEQESLFARAFEGPLLRGMFRLAFRPRLYGGRGINEQALQHHNGGQPLGERFFERFRDACTQSLASENYLLQIHLLGEVRTDGAVPEYLSERGFPIVRRRAAHMSFLAVGIADYLQTHEGGLFDRFHLSNLPDWLSTPELDRLFALIERNARKPARVVWRYLHRRPAIPEGLRERIHVDHARSAALTGSDRFPVYTVETAAICA